MKNFWFVQPDPRLKNNLMAFGYECGEGWYPLIEELFTKLDKLITTCYPELISIFEITQVKEKWGRLTIYTSTGNDEIWDLIDKYSRLSETICEKCGKPGEMHLVNGWYSTLCKTCLKEVYENYEKKNF